MSLPQPSSSSSPKPPSNRHFPQPQPQVSEVGGLAAGCRWKSAFNQPQPRLAPHQPQPRVWNGGTSSLGEDVKELSIAAREVGAQAHPRSPASTSAFNLDYPSVVFAKLTRGSETVTNCHSGKE